MGRLKTNFLFALKTLYKNFVADMSALGGLPFYGIIVAYYFLEDASFAISLVYAVITLLAITYSIKFVYFRRRPDIKKTKFPTLLERMESSSFPSVHAGRAGILYMALFYGTPLSVMGAVLLLIVLSSRVSLKRHYPSDVIAGSSIGLAIGYLLFVI